MQLLNISSQFRIDFESQVKQFDMKCYYDVNKDWTVGTYFHDDIN